MLKGACGIWWRRPNPDERRQDLGTGGYGEVGGREAASKWADHTIDGLASRGYP